MGVGVETCHETLRALHAYEGLSQGLEFLPITVRGMTSEYPTAVSVITVMYRASWIVEP